jgi:hypothetical protein
LIAIKWKRIVSMLILSIAAFAVLMACTLSGVPFLSQAEPTATRRATRVARATFTPRPASTDTPIPEPTEEPTQEPTEAPTDIPEPTARPTRRPVTVAPPPPTAVPQPTGVPATEAPKFPFKASIVTCQHAGNAYIKGSVCNDNKCQAKLSGMTVVMSDAPFGTILDKVKTDVSGDYTFTRNSNGPEPGNWYVWVVNNQDQPQSDASPLIQLDMGHNSDDLINKCPNTSAFVSFYKP